MTISIGMRKFRGAMEGGFENSRFSSYWNDDTEMTYRIISAKIPVKNPWEIFAYLPFGNWNDLPGYTRADGRIKILV